MLPTAAAPMARRITEGSVTITSSAVQVLLGSVGCSTATRGASSRKASRQSTDFPTGVGPSQTRNSLRGQDHSVLDGLRDGDAHGEVLLHGLDRLRRRFVP